jgi:isoquinoline 1-oxidoreductase alpha subunit
VETIEFFLNDEKTARSFTGHPDTPLLWVLRENCAMTGTKFGCGIAQCGACTVHMDNLAIRSCVKRIRDVQGAHIRTIEGLAQNGQYNPLQQVWVDLGVPQCGYCQSGQIMSAVALIRAVAAEKRVPTDEEINVAMSGNICRCGTYPRIRAAIKKIAASQLE